MPDPSSHSPVEYVSSQRHPTNYGNRIMLFMKYSGLSSSRKPGYSFITTRLLFDVLKLPTQLNQYSNLIGSASNFARFFYEDMRSCVTSRLGCVEKIIHFIKNCKSLQKEYPSGRSSCNNILLRWVNFLSKLVAYSL